MGVWAEMARILNRVRPCCTFRAIAVQYGLVRGTSGTLIIPGSWVRAPPAPPAVYRSLTRNFTPASTTARGGTLARSIPLVARPAHVVQQGSDDPWVVGSSPTAP